MDAAVAWGRERAGIVLVRFGYRTLVAGGRRRSRARRAPLAATLASSANGHAGGCGLTVARERIVSS